MSFELDREQKRELAQARVRLIVFDAVHKLWSRRQEAGLTQKELAECLDRDPAWVSKALAGPSNWTLRTIGELVMALDGRLQIVVEAAEDIAPENYDVYEEIDDEAGNELGEYKIKEENLNLIEDTSFTNSYKVFSTHKQHSNRTYNYSFATVAS